MSGSSTVQPISEAVSEAFKEQNPGFDYTVEGPGTGDGFKKFCAGETDISDASRKIKADDTEDGVCKTNGVEYVELKVAIDGISVMTSPSNNAVTCLSFPDLYALVGPESTGFAKWSDAGALAKELGSNTTFPDAALTITGPGEESGTYDSFVELALDPEAKTRDKIDPETKHTFTRPDYTASAQRQRDHPGRRRQRHVTRLGGLRLPGGEPRQGQGDPGREGCERDVRRSDRRDHRRR